MDNSATAEGTLSRVRPRMNVNLNSMLNSNLVSIGISSDCVAMMENKGILGPKKMYKGLRLRLGHSPPRSCERKYHRRCGEGGLVG